MAKTNRIIWIDWLKAILINTVIIGHTYSSLAPIIYLFHMPLFFFISGMLTNTSKQREQGLWKSIKALIYGIIVWNLIFIVVNAISINSFGISINPSVKITDTTINNLFIRPLLGIIFCNYSNNALPLIPQFWFVWTLILCKICFFYISLLNRKIVYFIIAACIFFTIMNTSMNGFINNYYLTRLIESLPFFISGYIFNNRQNNYIIKKANITTMTILAALCVGTVYYMCIHNHYIVNFANYQFEPSFIIILFSFPLFTFLLIEICKLMPSNSIITTISTGTFFILAIHRLLIIYLKPFFTYDNTSLLLSFVITAICYLILNIIGGKVPFLLGKM